MQDVFGSPLTHPEEEREIPSYLYLFTSCWGHPHCQPRLSSTSMLLLIDSSITFLYPNLLTFVLANNFLILTRLIIGYRFLFSFGKLYSNSFSKFFYKFFSNELSKHYSVSHNKCLNKSLLRINWELKSMVYQLVDISNVS